MLSASKPWSGNLREQCKRTVLAARHWTRRTVRISAVGVTATALSLTVLTPWTASAASQPSQDAACELLGEVKACPNGMLAGADLTTMYLEGADLRGANLRGANLSMAILTGANLNGADLTDANLDTATLTGASLRNAVLVRANFREADLGEVDFTGATFDQTVCNDGRVTDRSPC